MSVPKKEEERGLNRREGLGPTFNLEETNLLSVPWSSQSGAARTEVNNQSVLRNQRQLINERNGCYYDGVISSR